MTGARPTATSSISASSVLSLPLERQPHAAVGRLGAVSLVPVSTVMPRFLKDARSSLETSSSSPAEPRQHLDQGDLGAEGAVDRRELGAHGAGAEDHDATRARCSMLEDVVGVEDLLAVGLAMRDVARHRAGGDAGCSSPCRWSSCRRRARPRRVRVRRCGRSPWMPSTPFFLNRKATPRGVLVDDLRLRSWASADVEQRLAGVDAEAARPRGAGRAGRRDVQQRLGGDAAAQQAGAAEAGVLLHHRHLETELAGADRRHVAAGTAAEDDQVVVLSRHADLQSKVESRVAMSKWLAERRVPEAGRRGRLRRRASASGLGAEAARRSSTSRASGTSGSCSKIAQPPSSAARGSQSFLFASVVTG